MERPLQGTRGSLLGDLKRRPLPSLSGSGSLVPRHSLIAPAVPRRRLDRPAQHSTPIKLIHRDSGKYRHKTNRISIKKRYPPAPLLLRCSGRLKCAGAKPDYLRGRYASQFTLDGKQQLARNLSAVSHGTRSLPGARGDSPILMQI